MYLGLQRKPYQRQTQKLPILELPIEKSRVKYMDGVIHIGFPVANISFAKKYPHFFNSLTPLLCALRFALLSCPASLTFNIPCVSCPFIGTAATI